MNRLFLMIALLFPMLANAKEKPPTRACRILFLTPPEDAPKKLFLFDGTASREVELPEMNLSEIYRMPAGDADLYLTPDRVDKPGQIPAGAPTAKLPASFGDFYVVITSDPANAVTPVRFRIMDAGPEKYRKGQLMWFNLTSNAVSGQLGEQKLELAAQSRAVVNDPAKANEPFDVDLSYLVPGDPQPHPISRTKWVHDPLSRMVMIVHADADSDVPQVMGFKDFRDSPQKAK